MGAEWVLSGWVVSGGLMGVSICVVKHLVRLGDELELCVSLLRLRDGGGRGRMFEGVGWDEVRVQGGLSSLHLFRRGVWILIGVVGDGHLVVGALQVAR